MRSKTNEKIGSRMHHNNVTAAEKYVWDVYVNIFVNSFYPEIKHFFNL